MHDALDTQLLHALQVDGRAPFSLMAQVLGVSDQTMARRYTRLATEGLLRVRGQLDQPRVGQAQWLVRLQCTPNAAAAVADALARRPDTSWISLTSGGTEIISMVSTPLGESENRLLLETLPRSRSVVSMTAHAVLHTFFGGPLSLLNKQGPLTGDQVARLAQRPGSLPAGRPYGPQDAPLLAALETDGRASIRDLAAATGWSETTVRRRMTQLRVSGELYFDVDFHHDILDLQMRAGLWLSVAPDRLISVGDALAAHPETGYVAAVTGASNVYVAAVCPDSAALFTYMTTRVAALSGVLGIETSPMQRTVKRAGIMAPA
ncbi:MAG TPA: AsnC family transcriptional regulator [Solirubrobacteraceae bacterium]|jgi:DNA-binding Lrp family transcriptional regulator|nr:AsnC family transcriptional regulator [Solirubrobacteraceae bacterium]